MNYFHALILSIIEGVTEFLPVSSTGHLILAGNLMNLPSTEFQKSFEIIIQLGAILAVVILYMKTLMKDVEAWKRVLIAFIPTGVLGLVLYKAIKHYLLGNSYITVFSLFLGGIILIVFELLHKEKEFHTSSIGKIPFKSAFLIGLFQSVSMIPGVSRAAATIFGGMVLGLRRKTAVEFSFLLAVPTMFAATTLDLVKSNLLFSRNDIILLLIGFIGSFITAFFTVKFLLQFIRNHNFIPFGIYRIIISIVLWFLVLR